MKIALLIPDNRDEFRDWGTSEPRFGTAPSALLEGFAQIPECEIHVLCCVHRPVRSPEKLAPNIWYHSLAVSRWGWRGVYLGCVFALRTKLRELRPDIAHGQGTERYCALSAAFCGRPNLITVHGNMRAVKKALGARNFSLYGLTALLESIALRVTDGVICLTNYARHQVDRLAAKTWIVPNAVDHAFFEIERAPDPHPILLCVADAAAYKNQVRLIKALDDLAMSHSFKLVLAGKVLPETDYGAEVQRLCQKRNWCEHVGLLDQKALKQLLGRATALVHPSLEDNCPMAILEAAAAGVPVAASNIGGIPDLIEGGVTGVLFDPESLTSIRDGVALVLFDSAQARAMSECAQTRARERFAPRAVAQRHLEIYRELLANLPRPSASETLGR